MTGKIQIKLLFLFTLLTLRANSQTDSLYPTWIKNESNFIYFEDASHLKNTTQKWGSKDRSFVILHIGDSHLQNENLPNQSRKLLQGIQGDAGIGLIVPFSTVKSYDARFYKSTHTGIWHYSKSYMGKFEYPMGVRGMTSFTDDSAATFNIAFAQKVSKANNELVVFRHAGDSIYDLSFMLDDKPAVLKYTDSTKVVFNVFGDFSNLTCKIQKSNSIQSSITITGIVLQDSLHRGGLWHNAGVGAAPYRMVLSEAYYEQEAKFLNPDLVIIDLGTNDFLYANRIEADLRNTIITVIEKVRGANPNADIILTDAQEMKYKGKRTTVANEFSSMMYSIAKEKNCGFWSYYHVSGGRNAWHYWADAKLTQGDGIHLNGKGSELKGTLLFHAIDNSVSLIRNEKVNSKAMKIEDETMNLTITSIDSGTVVVDTVANENINTSLIRKKEKIKVKDTKSPYFYIVKKNDTVGAISLKTKVPIAKIRTLNHLKNDLIKPGQKLKLK